MGSPSTRGSEQVPGLYAHIAFAGSGDMPWVYGDRATFYDSPGDKDLALKIFATAPYASAFSTVLGLHHTLLIHKPANLAGFLGRTLFWAGPPAGVAAAFCTGTFAACNVRGKDDELSHFLGGVAAGSMVGAWSRSIFVGVASGVALGILAALKKYSVDRDFDWFPDVYREAGSFRTAKNDYSIFPDDLPRGWTTNPDQA